VEGEKVKGRGTNRLGPPDCLCISGKKVLDHFWCEKEGGKLLRAAKEGLVYGVDARGYSTSRTEGKKSGQRRKGRKVL